MKHLLSAAITLALAGNALADTDTVNASQSEERRQVQAAEALRAWQNVLARVQVVGTREDARNVAGTAAVVDPEQVRVEARTDINQLLKTVPGVYIREEEGEGLRPNIGIRAAAGGRSSKVTVLEDGVMIAPAPYSNPAAYYFPEAFQMHAVEVLKGAPLLRYGPQTTGGVINLITTPIPAQNSGRLTTLFGEHGEHHTHAYYGGQSGNVGWLLDAVRRNSDGFKTIDRSGRDAGFGIESYKGKFAWSGQRQSLLAKVQYSEQLSNETYAGLTDADFARDPNRRYGLSEIDQLTNRHKGASLHWDFDINETLDLSVVGYRNDFARDWFKTSLNSLINAANQGDVEAQQILDGERDLAGLDYTHGNREYESYGVEINLGAIIGDHRLQFGVRDHRDRMDRWQEVEVFDQVNGSLLFQEIIAPTGSNNRLEGADALSLWFIDEWQATNDLTLNFALRYEDVDSFRDQFSTPDRSDAPSQRSNSSAEWLPGVSLAYDLTANYQLVAGVHRGFAPLGGGATENQEPETSTNYELGLRYAQDRLFVELVGFLSDFSNQAEVCSIASPCSNGSTSGTFVTGEAVVRGLELQFANEWRTDDLRIPLNVNYTFSDAQISADNPVSGVLDGDQLADIPDHVFSLRLGFEHSSGWNNYFVAKYMGETCVSVGCNRSDSAFVETDSLLTMDWISRYSLNGNTTLILKVDNLFDEQVIIARSPHGARPNKPRTAMLGLEIDF